MPEKPRRRVFQFRLRMLLVIVAVLSIPLAWVGYCKHWIRQRHEISQNMDDPYAINCFKMQEAPWPLWIFGEPGYSRFVVYERSKRLVGEIIRLFPEAKRITEAVRIEKNGRAEWREDLLFERR